MVLKINGRFLVAIFSTERNDSRGVYFVNTNTVLR